MRQKDLLDDVDLRHAKPKERWYRLRDGGNLCAQVEPTGTIIFYYRIKMPGVDSRISLGHYGDITLAEARTMRDEMRKTVKQGTNPTQERKAAKLSANNGNTFEDVAREFLEKKATKLAPSTMKKIIQSFERNVYPFIGSKPVVDITPHDMLALGRRIEKRAPYTARRILCRCREVICYAVQTLRAERDPTVDILGAFDSDLPVNHRPALTEIKDIPKLANVLRTMDGYTGAPQVQCALKIAPYLFVRFTELRHMKWEDVDFETREWRYTPTKKNSKPHVVPLASQAVTLLHELKEHTGHSVYVLQGLRCKNRPISENNLMPAMMRMGINTKKQCVHGFKSTARTFLREVLKYDRDIAEKQLSHTLI